MNIWINGCFDVLHHGHYKLISYASSLGVLTVGIDSDRRIKTSKGISRPFHNESQRKFNLSCIKGVDRIFVFDTDEELENLIKKEKPDIMVIGSDYKDKKIIGSEFLKEILYFPKIKNVSTTNILSYENSSNR